MRPAVPGTTLRREAASIATILKEYRLSILLSPRIQLTSQSPRLPIATPPRVRPAVPGTTLRREAAFLKYRWTTRTTTFLRKDVIVKKRIESYVNELIPPYTALAIPPVQIKGFQQIVSREEDLKEEKRFLRREWGQSH
jgi:hypothetical protein